MIFNRHGFQIDDDLHLPAGETFKDPASTSGFLTEIAGYKILRWQHAAAPPWLPRRRVVLLDRQQGVCAPQDGRRYVVALHYAWSSSARGGVAYRELSSAESEFVGRVEALHRTDATRAAERARLAARPDLDSPQEARVRAALTTAGLRFAVDDDPCARSLRVSSPSEAPMEIRAVRFRPGMTPRAWWISSIEPYAG